MPKFNEKPSIGTILRKIFEIRPDLFDIPFKNDKEYEYSYNKHRILIDLVDDIAFYNGYELQDLVSPWTILREMYKVKREKKLQKELSKH